jgi:hypothetical protein
MPDIHVCSTGSWSAARSAPFTFINSSTTDDVAIFQDGNNPWPFTSGPPLSVTKQSSFGGKLPSQLISTPGTYTYNSAPCRQLGNPKTVIIT